MLIVRNAKQKQGTFEGKAYDNVVIFAEDTASTNKQLLFGHDFEMLKIKTDAFKEAFERNKVNGFSMISEMEGAIINPVYDKWGNVCDFTIYPPDSTLNGAMLEVKNGAQDKK